jgi:hypothetical protein
MRARGWRIENGAWFARLTTGLGRAGSPLPAAARNGVRALPLRLCVVALISLLASAGFAQSYSIDWYKVSGGGGTSTGGVYAVSGTIGQHDAGRAMTGGNYSLTGGFWSLVSVVQTAGAPLLYISHSGNTVTVYWQAVSGWTLRQNSNLTVPAGWTGSSGVTTSNGTNYLNLTSPTGNLFFRLSNP